MLTNKQKREIVQKVIDFYQRDTGSGCSSCVLLEEIADNIPCMPDDIEAFMDLYRLQTEARVTRTGFLDIAHERWGTLSNDQRNAIRVSKLCQFRDSIPDNDET